MPQFCSRGRVAAMAAQWKGGEVGGGQEIMGEEFVESSLARSVIRNDPTLVKWSLQQGENFHIRCQKTGRTLFHLISLETTPMTEVKCVPMVYLLSNAGLDLDLADNDGVTPLQLAIRRGLLEVMTSLLKCGAQCQGDEETLAEKHGGLFFSEFVTTLRRLWPGYWQAVEENNTFRVNKLVKSWCRINVTRQNITLIEHARSSRAGTPPRDPKLIQHLVQHEASVELAHAVMAGDEQRVRFLLHNGAASVDTADLSHRENFFQPFAPLTLVGAAWKYGHKHLLGTLRSVKRTGKIPVEEGKENAGRGVEEDVDEDEEREWQGVWGGETSSKSVVCEVL